MIEIIILITIGLFAAYQIGIFIQNLIEKKKIKQIDKELRKLHEVKVTPYLDSKVKFTVDLADEKDAILSLMYVRAGKRLKDFIKVMDELEKPHKVEIVVTTTET